LYGDSRKITSKFLRKILKRNSFLSFVKNNVGFNLAGLKLIRRQIEEKNDVILFADATQKLTSNETKKRKKGKSSAAILTIKGTSALV
jgi:hypothetical protein